MDYKPKFIFKQRHVNTMFQTLFRKVKGVNYIRERIDTPDGDFLDLDFSRVGSRKVVLICHGLEGHSKSKYVLGMVRTFNDSGYDAVAMNMRGCSGEPNKKDHFYHSGLTVDVDTVLKSIDTEYDEIILVGFSLGGNLMLKYLGEQSERVNQKIKKCVAISVPCNLAAAGRELEKLHNFIYTKRFVIKLKKKIRAKAKSMTGELDLSPLKKIKNLTDFDNTYTAPLNGFKDAHDYWTKCSSKQFLHGIRVPTLMINAQDDPMLDDTCFPYAEVKQNDFLKLDTPKYGGHVGFAIDGIRYWHEVRVMEFVKN